MCWKKINPIRIPLTIPLTNLKNELKKKNHQVLPLSMEENKIVQAIRERSSRLNINNVTRTKAYLDFFNTHPEIHWAFLAHMVSRNGGWNMTDLKGEFLSKLLSEKERNSYFSFLERANWLIFQDAFPQMLLYEESLKRQTPLFHLLPHLNVSVFMVAIWNVFWKQRDSSLLTIGLIVNEQNYIESKVVQNDFFKKEVFNTLEFSLQDFLSFNHLLFPSFDGQNIVLSGLTVHHFESLPARILIGKRLYKLLFSDEKRLENVLSWANTHAHSGSRKDYWPHLFNRIQEASPAISLVPRITACKIATGAPRIYSPTLEFAWKNTTQSNAESGDWYQDWSIVYEMAQLDESIDGDIQSAYCETLQKLELAAIAKQVISVLD